MSIFRHFTALGCCAALLAGCGAARIPPYVLPSAVSQDDTQWPDFLPVDQLLSGSPADFSRTRQELALLEGRLGALRRRAVLLRTPVIAAPERALLIKAGQRGQP